MRALALTTRYREGSFEGEACLLVYDTLHVNGTFIGDDVRDVLDRRPNTAKIFVLAPYLDTSAVEDALAKGSALQRAGAFGSSAVVSVSVLRLVKKEHQLESHFRPLFIEQSAEKAQTIGFGPIQKLPDELRHGWLFCLCDLHGGLVNAPVGVHFSKTSGKHSAKFLRTSSVLLSSEACGLIAFFALTAIDASEPRRVFVDTSALIAVVQAMQRIAVSQKFWSNSPPVKSFGSHEGLNSLPRLGVSDLVVVSASTSGGLASQLLALGVQPNRLVTLYFLKSSLGAKTEGVVVCDLSHWPDRTFGYPLAVGYPPGACELCKKGFVLAQLEGDQFHVERRGIKRLRIGEASQLGSARETLDRLVKKHAFAVRLHKEDTRRTDIDIDVLAAISAGGNLEVSFHRLLTRFSPSPANLVVAAGIDVIEAQRQCLACGLQDYVDGAQFIGADQLESLPPSQAKRNALVLVDYLCDHALLRGVNAQLRSKVNGGSVAYLAAMTIADSPRNLADLRIFLQYGEHGPETFIFRSASSLMLPWTGDRDSPWAKEMVLLQKLQASTKLPVELQNRLDWLSATAIASERIFLAGLNGDLTISPDFVLLNTKENRLGISQGDVYAAACNALAAERCDRQALDAKVSRTDPTPVWGQSMYVQSVICPSNFRDFNDAVLRGALLRGASEQELNYTIDETCSDEMYEIIRADILTWNQGKGDSLPEFLMAIACGRLRLQDGHMERLKTLIERNDVTESLKLISASAFA